MITVKLSHSILDAWYNKDYERAVGMYLGQQLPPTPAMELGKVMHQLWAKEVQETGRLPEAMGGDKLEAPVVEQKYQKVIPFSDDIQILLRGIPDVTDAKNIHEFKCGQTEAGTYVDKMQLDYMKILVPEVELGWYHAYNPITKEVQRGIKFLTKKNAEDALEHIITYGGEMIDYLMSQKQLIDFKA